jgi:hypothetical protein
MRFFGYTLGDPSAPMPQPDPEMYARMDAFIEEATKAGVVVATGGFAPLDEAVKISLADGKYTVTDGPFTEAKELVGGWALMETRDRDEAVEWVKRFLGVLGHGESTVRPVMM